MCTIKEILRYSCDVKDSHKLRLRGFQLIRNIYSRDVVSSDDRLKYSNISSQREAFAGIMVAISCHLSGALLIHLNKPSL